MTFESIDEEWNRMNTSGTVYKFTVDGVIAMSKLPSTTTIPNAINHMFNDNKTTFFQNPYMNDCLKQFRDETLTMILKAEGMIMYQNFRASVKAQLTGLRYKPSHSESYLDPDPEWVKDLNYQEDVAINVPTTSHTDITTNTTYVKPIETDPTVSEFRTKLKARQHELDTDLPSWKVRKQIDDLLLSDNYMKTKCFTADELFHGDKEPWRLDFEKRNRNTDYIAEPYQIVNYLIKLGFTNEHLENGDYWWTYPKEGK